jgi:hypothetical protein
MATWQERVKGIFGPNGYDNSTMRRSLQAIVLYEAKRCASKALATMKPFQRKAAFLDQCKALVESLDLLYPHQKAEVLWRTATSKEQVRRTIRVRCFYVSSWLALPILVVFFSLTHR